MPALAATPPTAPDHQLVTTPLVPLDTHPFRDPLGTLSAEDSAVSDVSNLMERSLAAALADQEVTEHP